MRAEIRAGPNCSGALSLQTLQTRTHGQRHAIDAAAAIRTHKHLRDDAVPRALVRQREEELREVRVGPLRAEVRREEPVRRVALGVERVVVRVEGPRVLSRSAAARDDVHVGLDVGPGVLWNRRLREAPVFRRIGVLAEFSLRLRVAVARRSEYTVQFRYLRF